MFPPKTKTEPNNNADGSFSGKFVADVPTWKNIFTIQIVFVFFKTCKFSATALFLLFLTWSLTLNSASLMDFCRHVFSEYCILRSSACNKQ